jgi:hypothetical protein
MMLTMEVAILEIYRESRYATSIGKTTLNAPHG